MILPFSIGDYWEQHEGHYKNNFSEVNIHKKLKTHFTIFCYNKMHARVLKMINEAENGRMTFYFL